MIPLGEARAHVLAACQVLPPRPTRTESGVGLVLGEPAVATLDVPPFANSAMDGFALRAADTRSAPVTLEVIEAVMAGAVATRSVGPGQAIRIMTGAPVPEGADAICMIEATAPDGPAPQGGDSPSGGADRVVITTVVAPGTHLRAAGDDVRTGEVIFPAGTAIAPAHLGALLSAGVGELSAIPAPRVGVLSTGDELVSGGAALGPGTIPDSNRPTLLAQLAADGFVPVDLGSVADNEVALAAAIMQGVGRCDAIVTSGGVSVGDHDFVTTVLGTLSAGSMRWMQIAIKPAKPFAFGTLAESGTPVFGLPGNPVSALVSYELLVRPALRTMGGHAVLDRPRLRGVAPTGLRRRPDGKLHLVRVVAVLGGDGALEVTPLEGQGSHQMRAMARANALALVPDGNGVAPGERVDVLLLDADRLEPSTPWSAPVGDPGPGSGREMTTAESAAAESTATDGSGGRR